MFAFFSNANDFVKYMLHFVEYTISYSNEPKVKKCKFTGAGFVPITGPPPKPAPPSFPNSPIAASPVKPIAVPAIAPIQSSVSNMGKNVFVVALF